MLTPEQPLSSPIHVSVNNVLAKKAPPAKKAAVSSVHKDEQDLASLEKEIFQLNMQPGISILEVTHTLLEKIERLYPGALCSVLRLRADNTLYHYAAPSLPRIYTDDQWRDSRSCSGFLRHGRL